MGVPVVNIGSRQNNRYGEDSGKHIVTVPHEREAIKKAITDHMDVGRFEPDRRRQWSNL